MSEMQVAVVGPRPENGGVGTYARQLANKLPEATHVTIPDTGEIGLKDVLPLARELRSYDVVNIHYTYQLYGHRGSLTWALYPLLQGCRVYTTMHEVWDFGTVETPPYSVKRAYLANLHRLLAIFSDRLVFLSKNARRGFRRTTSTGHTEVIPHGVNLEDLLQFSMSEAKQMFGFSEQDCVISQIGFVSRRKGIETFLQSAAETSEYEFMFAGGPRNEDSMEYYEELQERASENVTFTGKLPEERFHAAFDASNLVVLPYKSIRQSGILNWCAAHGTPVLASDIEYFSDLNKTFNYPLIMKEREIPNSIKWALNQPNHSSKVRDERSLESVITRYNDVISHH